MRRARAVGGLRRAMTLAVVAVAIGLPGGFGRAAAAAQPSSGHGHENDGPPTTRGDQGADPGITPSTSGPATAAATGTGARSTLVILVQWGQTPGLSTPAAPRDGVTTVAAQTQIGGTDSAWYQRVSYGQFAGWNATAIGWYTIPTPSLDDGSACVNTFRAGIQNGANQAAANAGFNVANYSVVLYYFSGVPCGWSGWTIGNVVWVNGAMNSYVTLHELGHTLGLGHGHSDSCVDPGSGAPVALSSSCNTSEYGDSFDVMGCCAGSFTAVQKADLGWLNGRQQDASAADGVYTIAPLELQNPALQAVRVIDGSETLWLEYRQAVDDDAFLSGYPGMTSGVVVHRQRPDAFTPLGSSLLDMTPGSGSGFGDAALPVGHSWKNPLGGATITVLSADPSGVQVRVQRPVVPDVVGETASNASTTLRAAGYAVAQSSFVDYLCEYIGLVQRQSPTAGTALNPGGTVTIWVGARPRTACP